jgi:cytoskeletal protein CcmA (bactofilin family)
MKNEQMPPNNETVIAEGVKVDGDFSSQGNVMIDGEVTGALHTAAALRIGPAARIQAEVTARNALIAGLVQGNLRVLERLDLAETAVVHGDMEAQIITVAAGAKINGRITTNEIPPTP